MSNERFRRAAWPLLGSALIVGLMTMGAGEARASLVLAMDLPALTTEAEQIVVGEVTSVKSGWDRRHERILSTIEIQVAEVWKGQVPGDGRLTIVQPGGVADGIEMKVHGMPHFAEGERAVLFLRGGAVTRPRSLVGMGQGKRGLRFDPGIKHWMVEGGDRSAAVTLKAAGRMEPVGPELPLRLEEMRQRIKGLVKGR